MPKKWSIEQQKKNREILIDLYIRRNLTINEVGQKLNVSPKTIFSRLRRLKIDTVPHKKNKYRNQRSDIVLPLPSRELAEFIGILYGDGHISHFQISVTLGNKELSYVRYVAILMKKVFGGQPKISVRSYESDGQVYRNRYYDVYLGSVKASKWCIEHGLVQNKRKSPVCVTDWIFSQESYMNSFLRGFFDTDGSIYALSFGLQISFNNTSLSILKALQKALISLKYRPSSISCNKIYLTRKTDIKRFFQEIQPSNRKHIERYRNFSKRYASVV